MATKHPLRQGALTLMAVLLAATGFAGDPPARDRRDAAAAERFVVLTAFRGRAVLDRRTGLVWERSPREAATWSDARHLCESSTAGGGSWRLPTFAELSALVGEDGTLPAGHPFLGLRTDALFWSATSHATAAYARSLTRNAFQAAPKRSALRSLCVQRTPAESASFRRSRHSRAR